MKTTQDIPKAPNTSLWVENGARLDEMEKEFERHEGNIACELSTDSADMTLKMKDLFQRNKRLNYGFWTIGYCGTCETHSLEKPFHLQLEKN